MTPTEIESLLERVRKAERPDDELDDDIWLAVIPGASRDNVMEKWPDEPPIWEYCDPERNLIGRSLVPRLTASVDAAVALIERVLPAGVDITVKFQTGSPYHHAEMEVDFGDDFEDEIAAYNRQSTPLALLEALLLALLHQASDKGNANV